MHLVRRARRFASSTRVFWRRRGELSWSETESINASRSGVLFRADRLLMVGTEIELIFGLSWDDVQWADLADVICWGRVSRVDPSGIGTGGPALAVAIESYSFIRQP